jgi:hypothetical protein
MKHSRNTSAYVECPFFHAYETHKICCEGTKEKSSIHLCFASPEERRNYMKSTCYTNYKNCLICKALYSKYNIKL